MGLNRIEIHGELLFIHPTVNKIYCSFTKILVTFGVEFTVEQVRIKDFYISHC